MTLEGAAITTLIEAATNKLLRNVRPLIDPKRQIRVAVSVQIGGQIYEKVLRSPVLDGDEPLTRHIKADIIT